ncbi:MAG: c-type cytochrome, partial [Gemmatimonadetes bacterium]|nr:c-type cytochrome [Gemmatimonadota bacterium]
TTSASDSAAPAAHTPSNTTSQDGTQRAARTGCETGTSAAGEVGVGSTATAIGAAAGGDESAAPAASGGTAGGGAMLAGGSTDPIELLRAGTCFVCHKLGEEGGPIGPPFDGMGARIAADRIRRGILEPNADTAQGFEAMAGAMPPTFGQQFNAAQLEALVQFLSGQK